MAQEGGQGRNDARMTEMLEKRAERLADDLKLKKEARTEFLETYKQYQQELMKHRRMPSFPAGAEEVWEDMGTDEGSSAAEEEGAGCSACEDAVLAVSLGRKGSGFRLPSTQPPTRQTTASSVISTAWPMKRPTPELLEWDPRGMRFPPLQNKGCGFCHHIL